jgi:RsbT co-antagonist protein rsbRD N-terminal domain
MTMEAGALDPPRSRLCDFLRDRRDEIIADWTKRMRALSPARDLSDPAIIDHLPKILTRIADVVAAAHTGRTASLGELPKEHAVDRLGRGFDLDQIVTEYGLLRRAILDLWESDVGATIDLSELRSLDRALDESVRQAALRYAQSRERLLKALDRIAESALGPGDLDDFLADLLQACSRARNLLIQRAAASRGGHTSRSCGCRARRGGR